MNSNPNFNRVTEEDNISTSDFYNNTSSNTNKITNTKYISIAHDNNTKHISNYHRKVSDVNHLKTCTTTTMDDETNININNNNAHVQAIILTRLITLIILVILTRLTLLILQVS